MQALKSFQLQRADDFAALSAVGQKAWATRSLSALDELPQSAIGTAISTFVAAQLIALILLSRTGRRLVFTAADTLLALVLLAILLLTILSLPIGAVYIGARGSVLLARSLADNFPLLATVLRPLLALLGQGGGRAAAAGEAAAVDPAAAGPGLVGAGGEEPVDGF